MNLPLLQGTSASGNPGRLLGEQFNYLEYSYFNLEPALDLTIDVFLVFRYFTFGAATAILALGLPARPDSSLVRWADRQAAERASSA